MNRRSNSPYRSTCLETGIDSSLAPIRASQNDIVLVTIELIDHRNDGEKERVNELTG
jgi:hypothetical protein